MDITLPAALRRTIRQKLEPMVDRLIFKNNGTIEARLTYFYRHGKSPDQLAEKIHAAFPAMVILETTDRWAAWPRVSYFSVIFRMEQVRELIDNVEVHA